MNVFSAFEAPRHVRRVGPSLAAKTMLEQLWYTKVFLGLRCDLETLPEVRPAKIAVAMEPRSTDTYDGFEEERRRARGEDYLEVLLRIGLCDAGVPTLYASELDDAPTYCQWLIRAADQDVMRAHASGRYPHLADDEVLLEGAYTFLAFRRMGVMADGMAQLLRIARDEGASAAITYVTADNTASLRGCAAVGFTVDHVRRSIRRFGLRRSPAQPLDERTRELWRAATS